MINSITASSFFDNIFLYNQNYKEKANFDTDNTNQSKILPTGKKECQTCKNRKYVDGSDESNVSFKFPSHISPSSSAAAVAAHESQHVANAVKEGGKKGNKLLSVSVSLKTSICPECGRVYTSGGETRTTMLKQNESKKAFNPYEAGKNLVERFLQQGQNISAAA